MPAESVHRGGCLSLCRGSGPGKRRTARTSRAVVSCAGLCRSRSRCGASVRQTSRYREAWSSYDNAALRSMHRLPIRSGPVAIASAQRRNSPTRVRSVNRGNRGRTGLRRDSSSTGFRWRSPSGIRCHYFLVWLGRGSWKDGRRRVIRPAYHEVAEFFFIRFAEIAE